MPFVPFHDHFPEIAERETRTITLLEADEELPAGRYSFMEMFCDEPGCDCRRVLLQVFSVERKRFEATINYGWESRGFYRAWTRSEDPEHLSYLWGSCLHFGARQGELAPALLRVAREALLSDDPYVARVKRHYAMFRDRVEHLHGEGGTSGTDVGAGAGAKAGRNDPCPCGSGRKYKKCCLEAQRLRPAERAESARPVSGGDQPSDSGERGIMEDVDYVVRGALGRGVSGRRVVDGLR